MVFRVDIDVDDADSVAEWIEQNIPRQRVVRAVRYKTREGWHLTIVFDRQDCAEEFHHAWHPDEDDHTVRSFGEVPHASIFDRLTTATDRSTYPTLSLVEYRSVASSFPRPNSDQMAAFAEFVSHAHSWYKHLPLQPPGIPMQFFLDPGAGLQREMTPAGRVVVMPREQTGFHYSWIPTQQYRDRFGYLAFSRSAGMSVYPIGHGSCPIPSDNSPVIYDSRTESLAGLPTEVLTAGRAEASGLIHTIAAAYPQFWLQLADRGALADWPDESGGQATVEKILERCRQLMDDPSCKEEPDDSDACVRTDWNPFVDYKLYQLLQPERSRQVNGMVAAMRRVCDLVAGGT